jgi:hypothetical protein
MQFRTANGNACSAAANANVCSTDFAEQCDDSSGALGICKCLPGFYGDLCDQFIAPANGQCPLPPAGKMYTTAAAPAVCARVALCAFGGGREGLPFSHYHLN